MHAYLNEHPAPSEILHPHHLYGDHEGGHQDPLGRNPGEEPHHEVGPVRAHGGSHQGREGWHDNAEDEGLPAAVPVGHQPEGHAADRQAQEVAHVQEVGLGKALQQKGKEEAKVK